MNDSKLIKENKTWLYISIAIKAVLIVLGFIGIMSTMTSSGQFMSASSMLFFTVQSNITIMAICAVYLVFDVMKLFGKDVQKPNWLKAVKYIFTVAITLTFVVFSLLLMPYIIMMGQSSYLLSVSNFFAHNLVPILAIADWLLFDYEYKTTNKTFLLGTIMPLYYLAFALICSAMGVTFGESGQIAPYFFLDYQANGWFSIGDGKFGVVYWIIILVGIVLLLSWLLILLKDKVATAKLKKATSKK